MPSGIRTSGEVDAKKASRAAVTLAGVHPSVLWGDPNAKRLGAREAAAIARALVREGRKLSMRI